MTEFNCKFCSYCKKSGHSLSECWSTRPADWTPEYGHSFYAFLNYFRKSEKEDES